ncbi:MAG TPA: hypothetical protein VGF82_29690 [Terracidiphilus sp.]|jgi:hypothetical protein
MSDDSLTEPGSSVSNAQQSARKPPYPVILIALFQFFKAGFLGLLFVRFWRGFSGWASSGRQATGPFLQSFLDQPFVILFPVLSVLFVVIGLGLLNRRAWARKFLIGAIICTWIGGRFGSHLSLDALFFSNGIDLRQEHLPTIFCAFILDLFVFCTLVFYPDIAKTFGEKEDQDFLS